MVFPTVEEVSHLNILIITLMKLVIFKSKYDKQRPRIQLFHSLLRLEAEKEEKVPGVNKQEIRFSQNGGLSPKFYRLPQKHLALYTGARSKPLTIPA